MQGFCFDSGREPDEDLGRLLCLDIFRPEGSTMRIGTMPLGQRRKLDVARLLARPAELFLLHGATFPRRSTTTLEGALDSFEGTIVVDSHDRALQSRFDGERIHPEMECSRGGDGAALPRVAAWVSRRPPRRLPSRTKHPSRDSR